MSTASTNAHPQPHSPLAHHFKDLDQQFDAAKMGIWLFILSEIMMFGGLFVAYIIFHGLYPAMFAQGAKFCDWRYGATNTADLIISSFSMACAVYYAQTNQRKKSIICMSITAALGVVFLIIHGIEYHDIWKLGLLPAHFFRYKGPHAKNLAMFFALYFIMTGLHGLHVTVGICVIIWMIIRSKRGEFNSEYYTPVEMAGLYWHFVDIIWIFLFPLLYLVG